MAVSAPAPGLKPLVSGGSENFSAACRTKPQASKARQIVLVLVLDLVLDLDPSASSFCKREEEEEDEDEHECGVRIVFTPLSRARFRRRCACIRLDSTAAPSAGIDRCGWSL